ncbi:MAG TPA: metallophosphoesterase family protein [Rubellimicrobium sp.]|nr:metallophosphoesterase family protein [Rubellimicrobium sp.]
MDEAPLRVGVISDTHGLLRPEALERLRGVGHILHAGDIGAPGIVDALAALAPVTAIRGNVDAGEWAAAYPEVRTLQIGGLAVHMVHAIQDLDPEVLARGVDVVVSGHSHRPRVETRDGTLLLNPGSAGPRRFRLPVTLAILTVVDGRAEPEILTLLA